MFTSRAENRLSLRYDTADLRLTSYARELGLVDDSTWESFHHRREHLVQLRSLLESTFLKRKDELYQDFSMLLQTDLGDSISLSQLSKRPELSIDDYLRLATTSIPMKVSKSDFETVYADLVYQGYIHSQQSNHTRLNTHDHLPISPNLNFHTINGLSHEMIHRFEQSRPLTFGQARRLLGITPAALTNLLVYLKAN
jgi:tRNA uridine 5-carboxymethylaminomethyl modification enzyme